MCLWFRLAGGQTGRSPRLCEVTSGFEDSARHGWWYSKQGFKMSAREIYVVDEAADRSSFPEARVDLANLVRVLRQLEDIAKRQKPRIAFKANGKILIVDLAEITAVHAEGNYVCLQHGHNPHLLRESLSAIAEKLRPYGFIRIHRSVVVNTSTVEEIQALTTGEYRLRVKGGKEYFVTRRYKESLRDLAQLWVGSERFPDENVHK